MPRLVPVQFQIIAAPATCRILAKSRAPSAKRSRVLRRRVRVDHHKVKADFGDAAGKKRENLQEYSGAAGIESIARMRQ